MNSWWDLGEHSGFRGSDLALYQVTCPFCSESGNFELAFRAQKKQPNGSKVLNFDTLKCGSCAGFVQVFWSGSHRVHDFRAQPWPLKLERSPEHYPEAVGRFWLQAKRNLRDKNADAAAVMARSSLQLALREHGATGANLKQEIDSLASRGLLPPLMKDWSHTMRELGNDSAHPAPADVATSQRDAADIVAFLDFLLEYLYALPKRIAQYRERKDA